MSRRYYRHKVETKDYGRARELRHDSSQVEQKFWFALKDAAAEKKLKFRRQQPIRPYFADFACMKAKLLIELDGMSHDTQLDYDKKRDAYLTMRGYKIIRIRNEDVIENMAGVIALVIAKAVELVKSIAPSPAKTKDLVPSEDETKSKFLLPLPRGERKPANDFETRDT